MPNDPAERERMTKESRNPNKREYRKGSASPFKACSFAIWDFCVIRPRSAGMLVIRLLFFLCALGISVAVIGCASDTKRKWLTFFFDGVPPVGNVTNAP